MLCDSKLIWKETQVGLLKLKQSQERKKKIKGDKVQWAEKFKKAPEREKKSSLSDVITW